MFLESGLSYNQLFTVEDSIPAILIHHLEDEYCSRHFKIPCGPRSAL